MYFINFQVPYLDSHFPRHHFIDDGQTLEIRNVNLNDAGNYSCRAMNPAGQDKVDFTLQVLGEVLYWKLNKMRVLILKSDKNKTNEDQVKS